MKWGVRRTPEQLGRHTLKKGTKIYRSTVNPNETTDGHKYVTYLKVDRDYYKSDKLGGGFIKDHSNTKGPLYEKTYELKEDLRIAGREDIRSIVDDIYTKDPKFIKKVVQNDQYMIAAGKELNKLRAVKDDLVKEFGDEMFKEVEDALVEQGQYAKDRITNEILNQPEDRFFLTTQSFGGSPELKNRVTEALKQRGFNAMTDEASVGDNRRGRVGVDPLIIFEGNNVLSEIGNKKISTIESELANRRYNKWSSLSNTWFKSKKNPW